MNQFDRLMETYRTFELDSDEFDYDGVSTILNNSLWFPFHAIMIKQVWHKVKGQINEEV